MPRRKLVIAMYIPWLLSAALQQAAELSYITAWLGSFFILYLTILSPVRFVSHDLPVCQQVMRPIVLIQLVFAGFMCCTSLFYFMDHLGYHFLSREPGHFFASRQTDLIAACQRLALLGHAALVTGIILATRPFPEVKYRLNVGTTQLLMRLCILSYLSGKLLNRWPGLRQFALLLFSLSLFCGAMLMIWGIVNKSFGVLILGFGVVIFNFISHLFTGFKESIITHLILLSFMLYPFYRRTVLLTGIPALCTLLLLLPAFTTNIRALVWSGEGTLEEAGAQTYEALFAEDNIHELAGTNWEFLTRRLSEIEMFVGYVDQVPDKHPYYGFRIAENSLLALIPRMVWTEKPSTEKVSMERVYELDIVNRASIVSAKSRPLADGYLSGGMSGVFVYMVLYGLAAQTICNTAESWFGGYATGCTVIFNGLFQQLWRGNTAEFLLNNIFYGFILMMILFWILKKTGTIVPAGPH